MLEAQRRAEMALREKLQKRQGEATNSAVAEPREGKI
jgi:hypothetical protein